MNTAQYLLISLVVQVWNTTQHLLISLVLLLVKREIAWALVRLSGSWG